jgi:Domain of unknown function (DUF4386)
MRSTRNVGRVVGGLLLLQLVGGLMLPYILLNRLGPPGGFLQNAAANAGFLRGAVFLLLFAGAVALGITIAAYPVVRQSAQRPALLLFALGSANLALQLVEIGMVLSMLSLSQDYAAAGADAAMLRAVASPVGSARVWAHFTQLLTVVCWIAALFVALWRSGQIPRWLGIAGIVTCALQIAGVPLRAFLGYDVMTELAMPLAPVLVTLALWLLVKGFNQPAPL